MVGVTIIENFLFIYLHGELEASACLLRLLLGEKKNTKIYNIHIHKAICKSQTH